jgi:hypothetical protein
VKHVAILFILAAPGFCQIVDPPPLAGYCIPLDHAASLAASRSAAGAAGLKVLEGVTLGRADEITAETEMQAGLRPGQLKDPNFRTDDVRQCAVRKLGETGLAEAVTFLRNLRPADFRSDASRTVFATSQLALAEAILRGIQDPQQRIDFLEKTAREPSGASGWAVDQLCDRGAFGSLSVIEQVLRKGYSGQRGEEEIAFCDARIRVLFGKPDRAKALGSVLNLQTSPSNARLTRWAIEQLYLMHSPAADAELLRFSREIDSVPDGSPFKQGVAQFRGLIALGVPQGRDSKPQ